MALSEATEDDWILVRAGSSFCAAWRGGGRRVFINPMRGVGEGWEIGGKGRFVSNETTGHYRHLVRADSSISAARPRRGVGS